MFASSGRRFHLLVVLISLSGVAYGETEIEDVANLDGLKGSVVAHWGLVSSDPDRKSVV